MVEYSKGKIGFSDLKTHQTNKINRYLNPKLIYRCPDTILYSELTSNNILRVGSSVDLKGQGPIFFFEITRIRSSYVLNKEDIEYYGKNLF